MNKVKNRIKRGFTVVPNELINDLSISAVARFLFVYMASKPDDWDFHNNELMKATGIKDPRTFRRHMSELITPGWISRERTRAEGAQFSSYDYTLHEKPRCKKCTVEPECKISTVEEMHGAKNAHLTNKDFKQINTSNKERLSFSRFWDLFDKKVERAKCEKKWAKISDADKEKIFEHVPKYVKSQPEKQYRKNPLTYLNGECWNDEIIPRAGKQPIPINSRLKVERGEEYSRQAEESAAAAGIKVCVI